MRGKTTKIEESEHADNEDNEYCSLTITIALITDTVKERRTIQRNGEVSRRKRRQTNGQNKQTRKGTDICRKRERGIWRD